LNVHNLAIVSSSHFASTKLILFGLDASRTSAFVSFFFSSAARGRSFLRETNVGADSSGRNSIIYSLRF
jgi:hypothetical protein